MNKNNLLLIIAVSIIVLLARLLPHAPNFSPLASVILFTGVYAANKKYLIIPLVASFISDLMIGFYHLPVMLSIYGSFVLIGLLGILVKKHKNIINTISATIGAGLLFFLLTNFAVWYSSTWYSHDLAGLSLCYNLAIPFFKSTLTSNLVYSGLLFGVYEGAMYLVRQKKTVFNK
ncbi:hypothetical protein K8R42_00170 [bacterium]|nr:hypothetical protein [bacterium]